MVSEVLKQFLWLFIILLIIFGFGKLAFDPFFNRIQFCDNHGYNIFKENLFINNINYIKCCKYFINNQNNALEKCEVLKYWK